MVGKNIIEMNQETINEAVEYYLNTRVFREGRQVTVTDVEQDRGNNVFEVIVEQSTAENK